MNLLFDPLYLYLGLAVFSFYLLGRVSKDRIHRILSYGMMTVGMVLGTIHAAFWMMLGAK